MSGTARSPETPVVIHAAEHPWRSNVFGLSRRLYGVEDVNYDWYSTWMGRSERSPILIITPQQAQDEHLHADRLGLCQPLGTPGKTPPVKAPPPSSAPAPATPR